MFYIIKDEKLQIFDDNKEKLKTTLKFMPQLQDERLLETDIITAEELRQHPNKVLIEDIQIEIDVPDFEEQEITKEIEVPDFETVTKTEEIQVGEDEDGNPIYETREWQEEVQTGTHIETVTEVQNVQVGSHKETITVKGLVLNPNYEDEKAKEKENLINHSTMTALDFVTYIKKAGVSDEIILQYLQSNPSVQLQLTLCQNVYCGVVRQLCPIKITEELTLTDEQVVNMFKDKNNIV